MVWGDLHITSCVLPSTALDFDETLNLLSFSCDELNAHSITRVRTLGWFSCGYISNQRSGARLVKTVDILHAGIKGLYESACIVLPRHSEAGERCKGIPFGSHNAVVHISANLTGMDEAITIFMACKAMGKKRYAYFLDII